MIPAAATSESVRVDLPWSTWAITDMDRMFFGFDWISNPPATGSFAVEADRARSPAVAPAAPEDCPGVALGGGLCTSVQVEQAAVFVCVVRCAFTRVG